jgi:hypothetical protein
MLFSNILDKSVRELTPGVPVLCYVPPQRRRNSWGCACCAAPHLGIGGVLPPASLIQPSFVVSPRRTWRCWQALTWSPSYRNPCRGRGHWDLQRSCSAAAADMLGMLSRLGNGCVFHFVLTTHALSRLRRWDCHATATMLMVAV